MNWLRRLFRPRNRYSSGEFSLQIVQVFRECVRLEYRRGAISRTLLGEKVGRHWGALEVRVPSGLGAEDLAILLRDLQTGLGAMSKEYLITQADVPVEVPEGERHRATERLRQMGFQPEVLPDGSVKLRPAEPRHRLSSPSDSLETMALVQAVHGRRTPIKELARSGGFDNAIRQA